MSKPVIKLLVKLKEVNTTMKLQVDWMRPIPLKDATEPNSIYAVDFDRLPTNPGVYVFGRQWGNQFEALYVGKANRIRGRIKRQLNNLHLMQHLTNAKAGKRVILAGCMSLSRASKSTNVCRSLSAPLFATSYLRAMILLISKAHVCVVTS